MRGCASFDHDCANKKQNQYGLTFKPAGENGPSAALLSCFPFTAALSIERLADTDGALCDIVSILSLSADSLYYRKHTECTSQ